MSLKVAHLDTIDVRVELNIGPRMGWDEVARFVKAYQTTYPERDCIIDGTNNVVLSRPTTRRV